MKPYIHISSSDSGCYSASLMHDRHVIKEFGTFVDVHTAVVVGKQKAAKYFEELCVDFNSDTYRQKEKIVHAIQWFPETNDSRVRLYGINRFFVNGVIPIYSGDWIIQYPDKVVVVSNKQFQNDFEKV